MAVTVPWNLLLTGCIIRSRGCRIEEVKDILSSGHPGVVWHPPKEAGRRSWVGARGEGCPNQPGLGVGGITLPSHPTIYPALFLLSCLPLGKSLNLSGPQFSHLDNRIEYACMGAKSLQSCPSLCNPMDCSLPGSSVHGILQARLLGWITLPSSKRSSQPRD